VPTLTLPLLAASAVHCCLPLPSSRIPRELELQVTGGGRSVQLDKPEEAEGEVQTVIEGREGGAFSFRVQAEGNTRNGR
jgi:hypothetical protein